jgi:5-formyltetrahydrofolate cyclo-ligase
MSAADHAAAGTAIEAALIARFPPRSAGRLGGYWPMRGEYDCRPLLHRWIEAGGAVALPAVIAPGLPLEFRPWRPGARMEAGRWETTHPAEGPSVVPDLLLVPLVGFDATGHRLGYGGGFYDRTLAALAPRPLAVGVGFELGRLACIRPQPHDAALDLIVTEAGVVFDRGA